MRELIKTDLRIEGIFRKNGNVKRVNEIVDAFEENTYSNELANEHVLNLAVILKRFLREIPEPLCTFRLHKLFTVALSEVSHLFECF